MDSIFGPALLTAGQHLTAGLQLFAQANETNDGVSSLQLLWLIGVLAVLILPYVVGNYLAKRLRMPAYGFRLGTVLLAITAAVAVLYFGQFKFGVDLRGGTILVYEIDPDAGIQATDEGEQAQQRVSARQLIPSLVKRINPSGTKEIVIRPYGEKQIEIIIPEIEGEEVEQIKQRIEEAGILRFAIVANGRDHSALIQYAEEQAAAEDRNIRQQRIVQDIDGNTIGFWAIVDREDPEAVAPNEIPALRVGLDGATVRNRATGQILRVPPQATGPVAGALWMEQEGIDQLEILMHRDAELEITGEDLAFVSSRVDQDGSPAVAFNLTDSGAGRFFALTTENAPEGSFLRQLGIVLDNTLLSAPVIRSPIKDQGQISGNFTRAEVDRLIAILQAGQLPAALTQHPIAENQVGSTLGTDTINKGVWAIGASLILVLIFILVYYRVPGIIACIALVLNLAMTLAVMILISQPITLPGLAGLVLTVGMSVDANVLIFERIREELVKGAADRMAIRNGFSRATTTIVDANLTTLITAIVLYAIGTDQVRGFAVTLILGILFSMFTAIYMSRTFFDIAERRGFMSLSMSDLVTKLRGGQGLQPFDFIGLGKYSLAISLVLALAGGAALFVRGSGIFDIDFAGGSSVTFQLDQPTDPDAVRKILDESLKSEGDEALQFTLNSVNIASVGDNLTYKVDTSLDDVNQLKKQLQAAFAERQDIGLVTYEVEVQAGSGGPAASETSRRDDVDRSTQLVAFQPPAEAPEEGSAPADAEASAEDTDAAAEETPAAATPETAETEAGPADQPEVAQPVVSEARLSLRLEGQVSGENTAKLNGPTLTELLVNAAEASGIALEDWGVQLQPVGEGAAVAQWSEDSSLGFSQWNVRLTLEEAQAQQVLDRVKEILNSDPVWISSSSIGRQVAGDMINRAIGALFASLLCVIAYIWFRFQRVLYGLAAVVALVHDVLITLGAIAISAYVAGALGFLLIDPFKVSLTVVAALLTIIGYSLNDTIVVFDRIRETKGKSLRLTAEMVNLSISKTLSRTLLTSLTTLFVVVVLYIFGGAGIHAFAFSLVIGVLAGTYSSIFVASPLLLWMIQRNQPAPR